MTDLPLISVVTPTFNSGHTLRETIESVLQQEYPECEHIVMDGGSTDGTLDILREYPHLNWVSEKDKGHYDAMNQGILKAKGEVVDSCVVELMAASRIFIMALSLSKRT